MLVRLEVICRSGPLPIGPPRGATEIAKAGAEEAAKEWAANIIPGITVIPSGTWGLNRAQEHGCTYCAGG